MLSQELKFEAYKETFAASCGSFSNFENRINLQIM